MGPIQLMGLWSPGHEAQASSLRFGNGRLEACASFLSPIAHGHLVLFVAVFVFFFLVFFVQKALLGSRDSGFQFTGLI